MLCIVCLYSGAFAVSLICLLPVDDGEPVGQIISSFVKMLEIICVFPDIDGQHRTQTGFQRTVLVGCCDDTEPHAVVYQPCVTGAEYGKRRLVEYLPEMVNAAEATVNGFGKRTCGLLPCGRLHPIEIKAVVLYTAGIVAYRGLHTARHAEGVFNQLGQRKPL